jgi:hypothetical protein
VSKALSTLAAVAVLAAVLLGAYRLYGWARDREASQCPLCHRPIHGDTAFSAVLDGRAVRVCCPRCWLTFLRMAGGTVQRPMATDYTTGKPVPAEECVYVEGSDDCPCCSANILVGTSDKVPAGQCFDRCLPSVIAFAQRDQAGAFSRRHGGAVVSYQTLLNEVGNR